MVALYITSLEKGSGKTTLGAGLGKHLLNSGQKVGFFKPIMASSHDLSATDSDAVFMKHLFALGEPVEMLSPVFNNESNLAGKIKEAYNKVSRGKDVVIVEGPSDQSLASRGIAAALDARVIMVVGSAEGLPKVVTGDAELGKHLLGVVLNKVPGRRLERVRGEAATQLDKAGVSLLGVIPEDRTLFALTIGEVAGCIQGNILSGAEKSAELVEGFMVGANCLDHGPDYFGRQANKMVVVRSERPDMQLAALETSVRCLVLSGDTAPMPVILQQAEEKAVPLILAKDNITTIVARIEEALAKTRFNQENKLVKLAEIMATNFDFQTVYQGLGLAS